MIMEGLEEVARRLVPRAPLPFAPRPTPLVAASAPPCAAVDGSHAVLADTGAFWVVAVRAAGAAWPGPPSTPAIRLHATTADEAQADAEAEAARHGVAAPPIRSAEAYAEFHRSMAEMAAATRAIHALPEGGLLLIDGALTQMPPAAQALADRVLDRATASGVHVAGVSKRSALAIQGTPLVAAIEEAAGPGAWWCPVPGGTSVVARLHPRAPHAFRIDAETEALPWLAHLARDAVYTGYPYPLAKAHNAVAITQREARRLRERLERALCRQALRLRDFHAVLDRNAPR